MEDLRQHLQNEKDASPLSRTAESAWPEKSALLLVCFLIGSILFLYLSLFVVNVGPIYRNGDQLIYLENAVKMFEGQTMYADFFQFTPPGTEFVYFCLFKLAGVRLWIPSVVLLLLGFGLMWLSVVVAKRLMSGADVSCLGFSFSPAATSGGLTGHTTGSAAFASWLCWHA